MILKNSTLFLKNSFNRNKPIVILVSIFILIQIPYLFRGLSGSHKWRQADTASVARNYFQESPNFFKPRIDVRKDKSGITGMEFPIYNYTTSIIYRVFNKEWFGWGQILSLLFGIGCLIQLFKIIKQLNINLDHKFTLAFALFMSDLFFRYSTRFMPETTALFMGLSGNFFFFKWLTTKKTKDWFLSWLFLSISILIRPYMTGLCLPVLVYVINKIIKKNIDFWAIILGIFILIPFYMWYFIYCPYLNDTFGLRYFFMGISIKEGILSYLSLDLWLGMIKKLFEDVVGWLLLPFFIYGIVLVLKGIKKFSIIHISYIFGVPLIVFLGLPIVIGKHYIVHSYYLFAAIPAASIFVAIALNNILKKWRKSWIFLILIFLTFFATHFYTYRKNKDLKELEKIIPRINGESTIKDLFVVENNGQPIYLYFINRKGWSIDKYSIHDSEKLKYYYNKGAKFALRKKKNQEREFELIKLKEDL